MSPRGQANITCVSPDQKVNKAKELTISLQTLVLPRYSTNLTQTSLGVYVLGEHMTKAFAQVGLNESDKNKSRSILIY